MSKAIEGAVMLVGAVGMGIAAFMDPALVASPLFDKIWASLIMGGISMEAAAIAGALTSNRGTNITTRQAAAFRQIIYGEQRIGGVLIYKSTTGGKHDQVNSVIVLAGHRCASIVNLYLDGRQVFWTPSNTNGNTTRPDGTNFGGAAAGGDHIGPDGQHYDFGGLVYCEARYGDQLPGDVITGLTANDPNWAPSAGGSPWVGGCTYIDLKREYDTNMFPSDPEIRITLRGKNDILDPRTGVRGYTTNWALIVADVIEDTQFGLGDIGGVNVPQLIAAANVCDEQVPLAGGGMESRYCCHWHYDTSTDPGNALATMMPAAAGRLSTIGGERYIWPAYWQGPTFSFDANALTGAPTWVPNRSLRELFSEVSGTYIAANFPYNDTGNLYDSNGWYEGSIENTFPFGFQPTSYPTYACDPLHGYPDNQYLNDDSGVLGAWGSTRTYGLGDTVTFGGIIYRARIEGSLNISPTQAGQAVWVPAPKPLPHEVTQSCCLSVSQAQRAAKVMLLRNRQQGSGTLPMTLEAWGMQPTDVMSFTFAALGMQEKILEVVNAKLSIDYDGDAPVVRFSIGVQETAETVYEWSVTEELTVYDVPAITTRGPYTPVAPTGMTLISGASTALIGADLIVRPRIKVQWSVPLDILVKQVQTQFQQVTPLGPWVDAGLVDVGNTLMFIDNVVSGQQYNVRIRSLRANGAASLWEEIDGYTVSVTLSVTTQFAIAPGTLVGEALSDGTANIIVEPFPARYGAMLVPILPGGPVTLPALNQGQLYFVYYADPTFAGGAITPVATQNQADYLNQLGYFLIDSIVTPTYTTGSGGMGAGGGKFQPSSYADIGSRTTALPTAAYDGDTTSAAVVSGSCTPKGTGSFTIGQCVWQGFLPEALMAATTLHVKASITGASDNSIPYSITASIGGTSHTLVADTVSVAVTDYTVAVPSGTNLSSISVTGLVSGDESSGLASQTGSPGTFRCSIRITDIYVQ